MTQASKRESSASDGASERANGRASATVLLFGFLIILDHRAFTRKNKLMMMTTTTTLSVTRIMTAIKYLPISGTISEVVGMNSAISRKKKVIVSMTVMHSDAC